MLMMMVMTIHDLMMIMSLALLWRQVDGYTVDDAVNVMQKAHVDGLACVISCSQEDAETYCEGAPLALAPLVGRGLHSRLVQILLLCSGAADPNNESRWHGALPLRKCIPPVLLYMGASFQSPD